MPLPRPGEADGKRVASAAKAVYERATSGETCLMCGGAGFIGPHDVGCPIEKLGMALGILVGEHSKTGDLSRAARASAKRAHALREAGDLPGARRARYEATRYLELLKQRT